MSTGLSEEKRVTEIRDNDGQGGKCQAQHELHQKFADFFFSHPASSLRFLSRYNDYTGLRDNCQAVCGVDKPAVQ